MSQISDQARFWWLHSYQAAPSRELWDQEIAGTKSFVVLPSLGSLVPGWLLIVPRRSMLSLRELNREERGELVQLQLAMAEKLGVFGGRIFAFEHGSSHRGSVLGCGVDQAHLHLVPLPFDLLNAALSAAADEVEWKAVCGMSLTSLPNRGEYISVWRVGSDSGAIGLVKTPISQWMRRLIARQLGIEEEWNYRKSPQIENVRTTVDTLRRSVASTTLVG